MQPKSLRAGPGWFVVSVPLPSGPNTGSNPGGGRVLNIKNIYIKNSEGNRANIFGALVFGINVSKFSVLSFRRSDPDLN